jgi:6-phosphogluconolactonase (cycloisomerase 2 family)
MAGGYDVYVTFSGESGTPIQHVRSFSSGGKDQGAVTPDYDELRGMALDASGRLLLAVANKHVSAIELFSTPGEDGTRSLLASIVTPETSLGIAHPYGLTFDGSGVLYVSNQDTNCVTGFTLDDASPPQAQPIPVASALTGSFPSGTFYAGQFVASVVPIEVGTVTPPGVPPNDGGLSAESLISPLPAPDSAAAAAQAVNPAKHSIRGICATPTALYVADQANDRIAIYDLATGAYKLAITGTGKSSRHHVVDEPVALAYDAKNVDLYIGSAKNTCIFRYDEKSRVLTRVARDDSKLAKLSGLAFTPKGTLLAASREHSTIYEVDVSSGKMSTFVDGLGDAPECLLIVPA